MICVYRHIRLDTNEPFYIGIGSLMRAYTKNGRNKFWKAIVNKTDYRVDILFENLTEDEAKDKEIEFIALYGRRDLKKGTLVNLTNGGDGTFGTILSKETKNKMSKIKVERFKNILNHPSYGKTRPDADRVSKIAKGRKWFTNGIIDKMMYQNNIADGFFLGRSQMKNKKIK